MFQKANRNQSGVARNHFQGRDMRVLFVCSAGCLRSPTGANVGYEKFGWNTRSCGSTLSFAIIPITETLIIWADRIVFVNRDNLEEVKSYASDALKGKEIQVLDIVDSYGYNDVVLKQAIEHQLLHTTPYVYREETTTGEDK